MKKARFIITYTKYGSEEFIYDCYRDSMLDALHDFLFLCNYNHWSDVDIIKIEKGKVYHE